jgi:hypothetical protein
MQTTQTVDKINALTLHKLEKYLFSRMISLFSVFVLAGCGGGGGDNSGGGNEDCTQSFKEIRTETDLNDIRYNLSCNYILLNDITLDTTLDAANGWMPIGNETNKFTGIFDGNGYKISGLWINTTTYSAGLFGYIYKAHIKNLGVEIDNQKGGIKGQEYVGGIAGHVLIDSSIANSYSKGIVSGNNYIGGIAGYFGYSSIINSYSNGNINGGSNVGGIAGYVMSGNIANSYSTGNISGSNVGGIAGYIYDSNIMNIYSHGNINGGNGGGIVGSVYGGNIANGYSIGSINGSNVGGIAGRVDGFSGNNGTVQNSAAINPSIDTKAYIGASRVVGYMIMNSWAFNNFALNTMTVKGNLVSDGEFDGIGKPYAEFKKQSTYESLGWTFGDNDTSPWKMSAYSDYPVFYWQE